MYFTDFTKKDEMTSSTYFDVAVNDRVSVEISSSFFISLVCSKVDNVPSGGASLVSVGSGRLITVPDSTLPGRFVEDPLGVFSHCSSSSGRGVPLLHTK